MSIGGWQWSAGTGCGRPGSAIGKAIARACRGPVRGLAVSAVLVAGCAGASAAAGLDADAIRLFGGRYAVDCVTPGAVALRVEPEALVIEVGGRTITGGKPQATYSYFGQSPPTGFAVALLSELRDGKELVFLVSQDSTGQHVAVQGDPKLMSALGARATQKYRHCDSERNRSVEASVREARRQEAAAALAAARDPGDPLNHPRLKQAYRAALGPRSALHWLAAIDGPSRERKTVRVAGGDYMQVAVCKPHDCFDNNAVLLFSVERGVVYGKVLDRLTPVLVGNPPPAVSAALERAWRDEWRQGR